MELHGWIERALQRVESLEAERAQHAGSGDPRAALRTIEIDAELEALVEALEAAADQAEAEVGAPGYTTIAGPRPQADDTAPMHVADDAAAIALDDASIERPRRRLVWPAMAAAVAVLALGVGAAVASSGSTREAGHANTTAAGLPTVAPTKVVAAEVPPDTQEPETAPGADVDATPPTVIPEAAAAPAPRKRGKSRHKRSKRKKARRGKAKGSSKRGVAFGRSRDPLSGLK